MTWDLPPPCRPTQSLSQAQLSNAGDFEHDRMAGQLPQVREDSCASVSVSPQPLNRPASLRPLQDISWGPLVFEARRFVELRKKTFSGASWPPAMLPARILCRDTLPLCALGLCCAHRAQLGLPAEQFWSSEALGMGIFYTLNVFVMQFYLGEQSGGGRHAWVISCPVLPPGNQT